MTNADFAKELSQLHSGTTIVRVEYIQAHGEEYYRWRLDDGSYIDWHISAYRGSGKSLQVPVTDGRLFKLEA